MRKEIRYFQNYLSSIKNLSNKTIESYTNDIVLLEKYLNSINVLLKDANNNQINNYLKTLKLKNKSYNRKITSIKEFYKYLLRENYILNLNIDKIEHIKNEITYPKIIKKEDIANMIAIQPNTIIGERNKTIIILLYISGLRVSELCNLTYNDINLKEGYLRCIGKGNKEKIIVIGELLTYALSNYSNNIRNKILSGITSKYVFVNKEGDPLTRQTIYSIISKAAKDCNIKLKVTPHTLRHCFATHMLENGADIRSVQEMLGHSNISTTQIYLNITNQTLKKDYFLKFKDYLVEDDENEI